MAEFFGAIQRGLGAILNAVYEVIPSYGVAIILLTVIVRVVLIPLTVKQIRAMTAQTKLQPELQKLRQKHKGDRQKLNEEVMKLYQEHGVNPLGGCFPLLMQAPVFIALYSVLRATIVFSVVATTTAGATVPADAFTTKELKTTICRPTAPVSAGRRAITCTTESGEQSHFVVRDFRDAKTKDPRDGDLAAACRPFRAQGTEGTPTEQGPIGFQCFSALGTGHLPQAGDLFRDVNTERAGFLGMHLACSATQVNSRASIRQCTSREEDAGGANLIPYYLVIALFVASTYYQSRQVAARSSGQMAQQQRMMMRIMPLFLGFISLSIPMGVNVYWLTSNFWTIGQQSFFFRQQGGQAHAGAKPGQGKGPGGKGNEKRPPSGKRGDKGRR